MSEKRIIIRNLTDVFNVGKTKVRVRSDGCFHCGTEQSSDWSVDHYITIQIGKRVGDIPVWMCADCEAKKLPSLF